ESEWNPGARRRKAHLHESVVAVGPVPTPNMSSRLHEGSEVSFYLLGEEPFLFVFDSRIRIQSWSFPSGGGQLDKPDLSEWRSGKGVDVPLTGSKWTA